MIFSQEERDNLRLGYAGSPHGDVVNGLLNDLDVVEVENAALRAMLNQQTAAIRHLATLMPAGSDYSDPIRFVGQVLDQAKDVAKTWCPECGAEVGGGK